MKNIIISLIILFYMPSALFANDLSEDEYCVYDSEYFQKIQIKNDSLRSVENLSIDVTSLENNDFEVLFSVNKYFKPFIIIGAKISEFLSVFNLSDLSKGIGANIHMNESFSYYAKYSSSIIEDARLVGINSSAIYVGMEYNF